MPGVVRYQRILGAAISAWLLVDGLAVFLTGHFLGRAVARDEVLLFPYAVDAEGGFLFDYGRWAHVISERGIDPHMLAPVFIVFGITGLVAALRIKRSMTVAQVSLVFVGLFAFCLVGTSQSFLGGLLAALLIFQRFTRATDRGRPESP